MERILNDITDDWNAFKVNFDATGDDVIALVLGVATLIILAVFGLLK